MTDPEETIRMAHEADARADRLLAEAKHRIQKFRCPCCDEIVTSRVKNGRMNHRDGYYWRQHACDACGETFTTKEIVEPLDRPTPAAQHIALP